MLNLSIITDSHTSWEELENGEWVYYKAAESTYGGARIFLGMYMYDVLLQCQSYRRTLKQNLS